MRHLIVFYLKGGSLTLGTVEIFGQILLLGCFPVLCRMLTSTLAPTDTQFLQVFLNISWLMKFPSHMCENTIL